MEDKEYKTLKDYFLEIMEKKENGLFLCEVPTGFGKSYYAAIAMHERATRNRYVAGVMHELATKEKQPDDRKIIYLTTLKKNVGDVAEELRKAYNDDELFEQDVMQICGNTDECKKFITKKNIQPTFLKEEIKELSELVNAIEECNKKDGDYYRKEYLEKQFEEKEKELRRKIKKELDDRLSKIKPRERLSKIESDSELQWIGELYPFIYMERKKTLLMTVSKFIYGCSGIYKNGSDFIKSRMTKNAIVFLDEFNTAKSYMYNKICEDALTVDNDYLDLFRRICMRKDVSKLNTLLQKAKEDMDPDGSRYERICQELDAIYKEYMLDYDYKMDNNEKVKQNFLFSDRESHFVANPEGGKSLVAVYNKEENHMDIVYGEDGLRIDEMLDRIHRCICRFRIYCIDWAESYGKLVNAKRKENQEDYFEEDNALSTIFECYGLSSNDRAIMLDIINIAKDKKKAAGKEDMSYYDYGFEYYWLVNNDKFNQKTKIQYYNIHITPEKILADICSRMTVIGLSATAEYNTVLKNFNLKYLKEKLGDSYHETPEALKRLVKNKIQKMKDAYKDINLHSKVIDGNLENSDFSENTQKYIMRQVNNVLIGDKIDYQRKRYFALAQAMGIFSKADIQSMLCFENLSAKDNFPEWDKQVLKNIFYKICATERAEIFFLTKNNFDRTKREIQSELTKGTRVLILSAYETIGAGQNLQYEIADVSKYIELPEHHKSEKDIDAVYLGNVTNVIIKRKENTDEERLKRIIQVEELREVADITLREKEECVKDILCGGSERRKKGQRKPESKSLECVLHAKTARTDTLVQADGRICRTGYKNKDIYILVNNYVFVDDYGREKTDFESIEKRKELLPPETVALIKCKEKYFADRSPAAQFNLKINNYNKALKSFLNEVNEEWVPEYVEFWSKYRKFLLKCPSCDVSSDDYKKDLTELTQIDLLQNDRNVDCISRYSHIGIEAPYRFAKSGDFDKVTIGEGDYVVDEDSSGLNAVLRYKGMRQYFMEQGYALDFRSGKHALNPIAFTNIYKGALGEEAGKYIFENETGYLLEDIKDLTKFEKFDFILSGFEDCYVDFKNWNNSRSVDREEELKKIESKMALIQAKVVFVINVVADTDFEPAERNTGNGKIIEIPGLIDENGDVIVKNIRKIMEVLR